MAHTQKRKSKTRVRLKLGVSWALSLSEKLMAEKSPNMSKDINLQFKKSRKTLNRINLKLCL